MMKKSVVRALIAIVVLAVAGWAGWTGYRQVTGASADNVLYGNVDIREVDLAFNAEGIVETMAKHEGDPVKAGELIATLEDSRYVSAVALAKAKRDQAKAQLDLLLAGTRQEEIDQARANLDSAQTALTHADAVFKRQESLVKTATASIQTYEDAQAALESAHAKVRQTSAALAEAIAGPRPQEIEAARAALASAEATLALAETELSHTRLVSPATGTVMTRVIEPGTVVLPAASIYAVAITDEVWVRTFAPEPMLARVAPGTQVTVTTDAPGGKTYRGQIGYVSPAAEFTPKTVETPELRTQLVYRLRIRIEDPDTALRQGMPVTVHLPPAAGTNG